MPWNHKRNTARGLVLSEVMLSAAKKVKNCEINDRNSDIVKKYYLRDKQYDPMITTFYLGEFN